eukprot:TRINITY_DN9354_c0_g1_i2.p1 TRINITY_DN9354_c0_g1~~TRINITY_DN9354_c0_g1_i2.p1  ORF type:complete len:737 (+),score=227.78 TRINITY_DN9354_c0_g1_i2:113-2212(+)
MPGHASTPPAASAPHPRYADEAASTERVTTSFRDFIRCLEDHRRLRYMKTEANLLDKLASLYVRCEAMCHGDAEAAEAYAGDEEALWDECRYAGWEKSLYQGILALRLRAQLWDRKRVIADALADALSDTYFGPEAHKFMFHVASLLYTATPDASCKQRLVELASACTALYPKDPLYFAAWLHAVAVLGDSPLLASTQSRCRTLSAVLDAAEKDCFRYSARVAAGLARYLHSLGEYAPVLKYVQSYKELCDDAWGDLAPAFKAQLSFLEALACLRLGAAAAATPELTSTYLNKAVLCLSDDARFPTHPASVAYAAPVLMQLKQMTADVDSTLLAVSERLLAAAPAASAGTDAITAYSYLLMLTGRGRDANNFLQQCKRDSGCIADADFPVNILPKGSGSAGDDGTAEGLGCQQAMVECMSAYMKAFHLHNELLRKQRALRPPPSCKPTGDPLLTHAAYSSILDGAHEFFAEHVLWSSQHLSAPCEREASPPAAADRLPAALRDPDPTTHFYVQAATRPGAAPTYMSVISELPAVPAHLHQHVLSPSVLKRHMAAAGGATGPPTQEEAAGGALAAAAAPAAPILGPELEDAMAAFADCDNESAADRTTHDLRIEYDSKDETLPFLVEQATAHFAALDRSHRGRIHLRTAVLTVKQYLRHSGHERGVHEVVRTLLPYLDPADPAWLNGERWVNVFFGIHRV